MAIDRISGAAAAMLRGKASEASLADALDLSSLEDLIRRGFAGDDFANGVLQDLAQFPEIDDPQAALATLLTEKSKREVEFADQLAEIVGRAVADEAVGPLLDALPTGSRIQIERLREGR